MCTDHVLSQDGRWRHVLASATTIRGLQHAYMLRWRAETRYAWSVRERRERRERSARALIESASFVDLYHRYVMPYDEIGRVCVALMAFRVAVHG